MPALRLAILFTLLFRAAASWALVSLPPSIEWLACTSDTVILGRPSSFRTVEGAEYRARYEACTFAVTATYKGARTKEITFYYQRGPRPPEWMDQADEYLVFLSVHPAMQSGAARTEMAPEPHYDKHLGDVLMPVRIFPLSVAALSGAWEAFNGEGRRLFMPQSVRATAGLATRALAKRRRIDPGFQPESRMIYVPHDPLLRAEMGINMKISLGVAVPSFMFPEPKWWHFTFREWIIVASSAFLGICVGIYTAHLYHAHRKI